ncbi:MAG: hypothetical protein ACT4QC_00095 [Planctomycetaceae bacterium]
METSDVNRRDFHRLTLAAVGGLLAGGAAGCGTEDPKPAKSSASGLSAGSSDAQAESFATEIAAVAIENHVCRGLNACRNQGASGENDCAGQGTCATVEKHSCGRDNQCKGQGGCGTTAVQNDCKGQGHCGVPLMPNAWEQARRIFEAKLKRQKKSFGSAPARS